jgi:ribosomal-protein-alanine N-acetyltransferase
MTKFEVFRLQTVSFNQVKEIAALEAEAFGRGGLNEWHLPVIIRHGYLFVAQLNAKIIAVLSAIRSASQPATVFIFDFSVSKDYRQKGYGRQLLVYALEQFKKEGFKIVQLTTAPENKAALHLYQSLGFQQQAFLKNEYGLGVDRFLMELTYANSA